MLLGTFLYSVSFYQPQGRYLFPAIGAIVLCGALGLRALVLARFVPFIAMAFGLLMLLIDAKSIAPIHRLG